MKKFLSIILIAGLAFGFSAEIKAQQVMTQTGTSGASKTTHTNADTSYHKLDLAGSVNNYHHITIAVAGTKTSGTVGGTALLQGSLDNSRWFTVTDTANVGSQSLTDGDNNLVWKLSGSAFRYYRVRIYTTGTQVSSYVCRLLGRKYPY